MIYRKTKFTTIMKCFDWYMIPTSPDWQNSRTFPVFLNGLLVFLNLKIDQL